MDQDAANLRLTELEIKLSYAEDQIDALNQTIYRQQCVLDALQLAVTALRQQLSSSQPADALNLRDELPPHY